MFFVVGHYGALHEKAERDKVSELKTKVSELSDCVLLPREMMGGGEDFGQAFMRRFEGLSMHTQPKAFGWHERRIGACICWRVTCHNDGCNIIVGVSGLLVSFLGSGLLLPQHDLSSQGLEPKGDSFTNVCSKSCL